MAKTNGEGMAERISPGGNGPGAAVAERPGAGDQHGKSVKDLVLEMMGSIKAALPEHIGADRFARIALVTVQRTPRLLECTRISLLAAIMEAAVLGLEPGTLGQCYLIPYWNSKKRAYEVQFQIGYKGYIELCRRSGSIQSIQASEVCENDEFDFEYGLEQFLRHKPRDPRGAVTCYYAYALLHGGGKAFKVMTVKDVERIKDRYSESADKAWSPWNTEPVEMALKTVIKRLLKYLPVSASLLQRGVVGDGQVKGFATEDVDLSGMPVQDLEAEIVGETVVEEDPRPEVQKPEESAPSSEGGATVGEKEKPAETDSQDEAPKQAEKVPAGKQAEPEKPKSTTRRKQTQEAPGDGGLF